MNIKNSLRHQILQAMDMSMEGEEGRPSDTMSAIPAGLMRIGVAVRGGVAHPDRME